jgi:hypothetical protein
MQDDGSCNHIREWVSSYKLHLIYTTTPGEIVVPLTVADVTTTANEPDKRCTTLYHPHLLWYSLYHLHVIWCSILCMILNTV